jgi:hypothetical protein
MSTDDEAARKARAQQIREQIKRLKTPPAKAEDQKEEGPPSRPKSYRDSIHERMHELDKNEHDEMECP